MKLLKNLIGGLAGVILLAEVLPAQIIRWDTREVIPGTELISLGPNVNLADLDLDHAQFYSSDLRGADFSRANLGQAAFTYDNLTGARFADANLAGTSWYTNTLTNADFAGANLVGANLTDVQLSGANLGGANVAGASFFSVTGTNGLTPTQFAQTASYQMKDLQGTRLETDDLTGWSFSGQDLRDGSFWQSNLSDADFSGADLRGVNGFNPSPSTIVENTILPDGVVLGLKLSAGEELVVRDHSLPAIVRDGWQMTDEARLEFVLAAGARDKPRLLAEAAPQLGGALGLTFEPTIDLTSLIGQRIDLFDWPGPLAAGNAFGRIELPAGTDWDLGELYTTGEVRLRAIPEPTGFSLLALGAALMLVRRRARGA